MSSRQDYDRKLETISSIPKTDVRVPSMPVSVYVQESENLYEWALDDRQPLISAGLAWDMVEDVSVRAGALRQAQSMWNKSRFTREEAQKR